MAFTKYRAIVKDGVHEDVDLKKLRELVGPVVEIVEVEVTEATRTVVDAEPTPPTREERTITEVVIGPAREDARPQHRKTPGPK